MGTNAQRFMAIAEFEGSVKNISDEYIDFIKRNKNPKHLSISILLKFFYPQKTTLTKEQVENLYDKDISDIDFDKIVDPKKPRNKPQSIADLFNDLGMKFNKNDLIYISELKGISSAFLASILSFKKLKISINLSKFISNSFLVI